MTSGLRAGTRAGITGKTATKQASAFLQASAALLELCNTEIQASLEAQIEWNPSILIDERELLKRRGDSGSYEEEPDDEDIYDPPDMEKNIETGESEEVAVFFQEHAEDFIQFVLRRIEEDFDPVDDAHDIERINEIFKDFNPENFTVSHISEDLKPWIESILNEFPSWQSSGWNRLVPWADIIFYKDERQVNYEINLGILDQIKFNKGAGINNPISLSISGYNFSPAWINSLIQARRNGMCLLAQFLKDKQTAFIQAKDIKTSMERLRSIRQTDFLKYVNGLGTKQVSGFNKKKDKSWATRVIKNKWIKMPFSEDLFPAKLFFDEHIGAINVLRKAIEIHVIKNNNSPLKAPDQGVILKALCGQKTQAQTIRKIIWPHLQKLYPEEKWKELGIMGERGRPATGHSIDGSDLAELINCIGKELKIPGAQFSREDIGRIKNEIF